MGIDITSNLAIFRPRNQTALPKASLVFENNPVSEGAVLSEPLFCSNLLLERYRAERSGKPFVVIFLDVHFKNRSAAGILRHAIEAIATSKRETDLLGWYKEGVVLGVIFTEVNLDADNRVASNLRDKIQTAVTTRLGPVKASKISFSLQVVPETWGQGEGLRSATYSPPQLLNA